LVGDAQLRGRDAAARRREPDAPLAPLHGRPADGAAGGDVGAALVRLVGWPLWGAEPVGAVGGGAEGAQGGRRPAEGVEEGPARVEGGLEGAMGGEEGWGAHDGGN